MQHSKQKLTNKKILMQAFFVYLLLAILVACGPHTPAPTKSPGSYATWTPSPSATATCAPDIQLSTPEGWGSSSRLIVILYDPRSMGDQYLELGNGQRTQDIPFFISAIVPKLMKFGDQVAIFQLGYSSYDAARVTRLYSYLTPPQLYNTPASRATLTPIPSPTQTPKPGYPAVAATNIARAQSTARAGTETANEAVYSCEKIYWNNNVKLTATAWDSTATAEIGGISDSLDEKLGDFKNNGNGKEKPFSTDELYYGGLYYGLSFATTVLQADCKNYDECILIIIDDLKVWGKNNPDLLSIDLSGAKIYTIMPNCIDVDQPSCMNLREYWDSELKLFGAGDIVYWNGVRVEMKLLNAIGR